MLERTLFALGLLLAPSALAAPPADELARLAAGETITRPYAAAGMSGVEAVFWVDAPPATAFRVLSDTPHLAEFMPNLAACTILEAGDGYAVVKLDSEQGEMVQRRTYEPPRRISWRLVRANALKDVQGRWLVEPARGGTVLSYAVAIQLAWPVPMVLVRAFQNRSLPALVRNVRARIESGGTWVKPGYEGRVSSGA